MWYIFLLVLVLGLIAATLLLARLLAQLPPPEDAIPGAPPRGRRPHARRPSHLELLALQYRRNPGRAEGLLERARRMTQAQCGELLRWLRNSGIEPTAQHLSVVAELEILSGSLPAIARQFLAGHITPARLRALANPLDRYQKQSLCRLVMESPAYMLLPFPLRAAVEDLKEMSFRPPNREDGYDIGGEG